MPSACAAGVSRSAAIEAMDRAYHLTLQGRTERRRRRSSGSGRTPTLMGGSGGLAHRGHSSRASKRGITRPAQAGALTGTVHTLAPDPLPSGADVPPGAGTPGGSQHGAADGAGNMALDASLADRLAAGAGAPTLRLYGWRPVGHLARTQPDGRTRSTAERCSAEGIDVVRRPTGGRAILHAEELTYCVALPAGRRSILRTCTTRSAGRSCAGSACTGSRRHCNAHSRISRSTTAHPRRSPASQPRRGTRSSGTGGSSSGAPSAGSRGDTQVVLQHGSILCGPAHQRLTELLPRRRERSRAAARRPEARRPRTSSKPRGGQWIWTASRRVHPPGVRSCAGASASVCPPDPRATAGRGRGHGRQNAAGAGRPASRRTSRHLHEDTTTSPQATRPRVVTTKTVMTMKKAGEKIAMLTAYDLPVGPYPGPGRDRHHPRRRLPRQRRAGARDHAPGDGGRHDLPREGGEAGREERADRRGHAVHVVPERAWTRR